jgi:hypothetical protein
MIRRIPITFAALLFGLFTSAVLPCRMVAATRVVTAAQVNGTWSSQSNEFRILALGKQRLKIQFFGAYAYQSPSGPTANTGEGSGIATIDGDTAIFRPDRAEEECRITLKFVGRKLVVTQEGFCGFGMNVSAAGTYLRTSNRKPVFEIE